MYVSQQLSCSLSKSFGLFVNENGTIFSSPSSLSSFEKAVAKVVGGKLAEYLVDDVFSLISTSESVNIELNRYILRSADGNKRFQVYATYRKLDGSFIDEKIVQQGII